MRFVDAAADRGDDLVDDAQQMRLVLEANGGRFEHALALDIDAFMAVDQNVVDGGVLEQRFERAEPRHLIENLGDEVVEFLGVEREPLAEDILRHQLLHMAADFVFRQLFQRRKIDFFDQAAVQPHLGVEELLGQKRIGGGGRRRFARGFRQRGHRHALRHALFGVDFGRRDEVRAGDAADGETSGHGSSPSPRGAGAASLDGRRPGRFGRCFAPCARTASRPRP